MQSRQTNVKGYDDTNQIEKLKNDGYNEQFRYYEFVAY